MNKAQQGPTLKDTGKKLVTEYSYILSFILLLILAGVVNTSFFKWSNISNIFVQSATTTGIIALGMTMIISAGMIDISVGAQVALISGLGIEILNRTGSIMLMLGFCMALGLVIGLVNGLLVTKGKMPPMIATLATQTICRSIINQLGQGGPFSVETGETYDRFRQIAAGNISIGSFRIPYPMLIFIAFGALFIVIMNRTKLGKHIYAVGSNETSAKLTGVHVDRVKILTFVITGVLCGFSSWLYSSRVMAVAASSAGSMYEMDAIAAVAIGGTSMNGGKGKVMGTLLGVLMFKIINIILTMADVPTFLNGAISGAIIIIAVLFQNIQNRKK